MQYLEVSILCIAGLQVEEIMNHTKRPNIHNPQE